MDCTWSYTHDELRCSSTEGSAGPGDLCIASDAAESYDACGPFEVVNIASYVGIDTGATGSDSWIVGGEVPCDNGCSLTPGYWKTHSERGPAPYDATWAKLPAGADTIFFRSGVSYYTALWTAPNGNAYWILAHAYIAAQLNGLNDADVSSIQASFDAATALFETYRPSDITNRHPARAQFLAACHQRLEDDRTAMALQLEHVLAGVGVRRGEEQGEADVDGLARRIQETGQSGLARGRQFSHQRGGDFRRLGPRDAHDTHAAASWRGSRCHYGVLVTHA